MSYIEWSSSIGTFMVWSLSTAGLGMSLAWLRELAVRGRVQPPTGAPLARDAHRFGALLAHR
jgi:hypothetical protein